MEMIVVSRRGMKRRDFRVGVPVALLLLLTMGGLVAGGFYLGLRVAPVTASLEADLYTAVLRHELEQQRARVDSAVVDAERNLDALAARVGRLQAHVMRVDALGSRLVDLARLDAAEFDFDNPPALGGPAPVESTSLSVPDFLAALDHLASDLDDRLPKLRAVETTFIGTRLEAEVMPAGKPVLMGWLSSHFGNRTDPMNGRKAFHAGVDFAGRTGTEIVAVASGVVIWSGRRQGYGRMVEIDHGNGYSTIYAHNRRNLVKAGDTVRKGEVIAQMGASGRATGTHVHFEVLRNGKAVNPLDYIRAGG